MFGTIFEKSLRSSVIFKTVGATPQFDQDFKPKRNLSGHFLYIGLSIYKYSVEYILKLKKLKYPDYHPSVHTPIHPPPIHQHNSRASYARWCRAIAGPRMEKKGSNVTDNQSYRTA